MQRRTKPLENWTSRQVLYLLRRLARWTPAAAIRPLSAALGTVCYAALPHLQRVARANLRRAFPELAPEEIERLVRRCFQHQALTLIEFLQMADWDGAEIERRVQEKGLAHLEAAFSVGRGVILISAHYGNWELAAARIVRAGYAVNVVARDADDAETNALLHGIRHAAGYQVIPRQNAARGVLACLRRNEVVVILMDQNTTQGEVYVDFFGHPAATTPGPAVLARRTGAPLVPGFIRRLGDGTYIGELLEPLEWEATDDPERDVQEITQRLTATIEAWIREEPEQWLWVHNRWKHQGARTATTSSR
ncbi:MAG: lysophospholipid acyltransferase family protein [Dehalococcoidia bacterium]